MLNSKKRKHKETCNISDKFYICSHFNQCGFRLQGGKNYLYNNSESTFYVSMQSLQKKLTFHKDKEDIMKSFHIFIHENEKCNYNKNGTTVEYSDSFLDLFIASKYKEYLHVYNKSQFCSFGPIKGDKSYKCLHYVKHNNLTSHEKKCIHRTFCKKCHVSFALLGNICKDTHEKNCPGIQCINEIVVLEDWLQKLSCEYNNVVRKASVCDSIVKYEDYLSYNELKKRTLVSDIQLLITEKEILTNKMDQEILLFMHKIRESKYQLSIEQKKKYIHCKQTIEFDNWVLHAKVCEVWEKEHLPGWNSKISNMLENIEINRLKHEIVDKLVDSKYVIPFSGIINLHSLYDIYLEKRTIEELFMLKENIKGGMSGMNAIVIKKVLQFDVHYLRAIILYNFYVHEELQDNYFDKLKDIYNFGYLELVNTIFEIKRDVLLHFLQDKKSTYHLLAKMYYQLIYVCTEVNINQLEDFFEKNDQNILCVVGKDDTEINKIFLGFSKIIKPTVVQPRKKNISRARLCRFGCGTTNTHSNLARHQKICSLRTHCNHCKLNFALHHKITSKEKNDHEKFCKRILDKKNEAEQIKQKYENIYNLNTQIIGIIESRNQLLLDHNDILQCFHCSGYFNSYSTHFQNCFKKTPSISDKEDDKYVFYLLYQMHVQELEYYQKQLKCNRFVKCNICNVLYCPSIQKCHDENCSKNNRDWYQDKVDPKLIVMKCYDCGIYYSLDMKCCHDNICTHWYKKIYGYCENDNSLQSQYKQLQVETNRMSTILDIKFYQKYYSFFLKNNQEIQSYFIKKNWEELYTLNGRKNIFQGDRSNRDYGLLNILCHIKKLQLINLHPIVLMINILYNIFLKQSPGEYQCFKSISSRIDKYSYGDLYKLAITINGFQYQSFLQSNYYEIYCEEKGTTHLNSDYLACLKQILYIATYEMDENDWEVCFKISRRDNEEYSYLLDKRYIFNIFKKDAREVIHIYNNIFHKKVSGNSFIKAKNMHIIKKSVSKIKENKNKEKKNDVDFERFAKTWKELLKK